MKQNSFTKIIIGVLIVAFGALILTNNLGIINFNAWRELWRLVLVAVLLILGLRALQARAWLPALFCGSFLVIAVLPFFGITHINFWHIFPPALIIFAGLSLMFGTGVKSCSKPKASVVKEREQGDDITAIFWGSETQIKDKYKGSNLTAVFGAVSLDLRDADIVDGSVIEIFAFCGGIDILLPDNVVVDKQVIGILGGVDNRAHHQKNAKKKLIIRGQCILGGADIK